MAAEAYLQSAIATLLTTELNSLANNTNAAVGGAYANTAGRPYAEFELFVNFGVAPTAGSQVLVWLLARPDGTNTEDGSSSITPARIADVVFPIRAVTGDQRIVVRAPLPPGTTYPLARNNATGQTMAASANTLKVRPYTFEGV